MRIEGPVAVRYIKKIAKILFGDKIDCTPKGIVTQLNGYSPFVNVHTFNEVGGNVIEIKNSANVFQRLAVEEKLYLPSGKSVQKKIEIRSQPACFPDSHAGLLSYYLVDIERGILKLFCFYGINIKARFFYFLDICLPLYYDLVKTLGILG